MRVVDIQCIDTRHTLMSSHTLHTIPPSPRTIYSPCTHTHTHTHTHTTPQSLFSQHYSYCSFITHTTIHTLSLHICTHAHATHTHTHTTPHNFLFTHTHIHTHCSILIAHTNTVQTACTPHMTLQVTLFSPNSRCGSGNLERRGGGRGHQ